MTPLTTDATWSPSRNFNVSAPVLFVSSGSTTACQVPSSPSFEPALVRVRAPLLDGRLVAGHGLLVPFLPIAVGELDLLAGLEHVLGDAPLMVMRTLRSAAWL